MSKHTPEPWTYDYSEISGPPDSAHRCETVVGQERGRNYESYGPLILKSEDARRIVACVNACAGLTTEALEAGALGELRRVTVSIGIGLGDGLRRVQRGEWSRALYDAVARLEGK